MVFGLFYDVGMCGSDPRPTSVRGRDEWVDDVYLIQCIHMDFSISVGIIALIVMRGGNSKKRLIVDRVTGLG